MKEVSYKELGEVIKRSYLTQTSLMVYGGIGIGKSQIVLESAKEICREKKKKFVEWNKTTSKEKRELLNNPEDTFIFADVRSSLQDPTDLKGLPSYYDGVVEWKPQLLFKVLEDKRADGLIFFDELLNAPQSVMTALYQLILDRGIGEISLNDKIGIVCAGNKADEVGSVFDMPEPLANRLIHVELIVNSKDWVDYALKKEIDTDIISYISWKPSRLYSFSKKNKDFTFASPRSWFMCSRLIANINSNTMKEILISSSVGEGIGLEFMTFLKLKKKLDVDDLLKHPQKIKKITKVDEKYALLGAISEKYKQNPKIMKGCIGICKNLEPEYSILLMRYLLNVFKSIKREEDDYIAKFGKEVLNNGGYEEIKKYQKYF